MPYPYSKINIFFSCFEKNSYNLFRTFRCLAIKNIFPKRCEMNFLFTPKIPSSHPPPSPALHPRCCFLTKHYRDQRVTSFWWFTKILPAVLFIGKCQRLDHRTMFCLTHFLLLLLLLQLAAVKRHFFSPIVFSHHHLVSCRLACNLTKSNFL